MARQTKARLDRKGLSDLGLERLIEILLEECAVNKPLKARMTSALAGMSGPAEVARLIDLRIETVAKARSSLSPARARALAVDLQGLVRNIVGELAALDLGMASERLLRFMEVACSVQSRLRDDSVRLLKVFTTTGELAVDLISKLDSDPQVRAVAWLERLRKVDERHLFHDALMSIAQKLQPDAAAAWKVLLLEDAGKPRSRKYEWMSNTALDVLQQLALASGDIDAYLEHEAAKPETRQDNLRIAALLYDARRYAEALDWVRRPQRNARVGAIGGTTAAIGGGQPDHGRSRLEADILDGLKRRDEAQAIRWREFERTLKPDALRAYIARLDDFAEFEELDKAFDLVRKSGDIYLALAFFIGWPKLDMAADYVMQNAGRWRGTFLPALAEAADALAQDQPVAATLLYRVLLKSILERVLDSAYVDGASYLAAMHQLKERLPQQLPFESHDDFLAEMLGRHSRKYGFWQLVPDEMKAPLHRSQ